MMACSFKQIKSPIAGSLLAAARASDEPHTRRRRLSDAELR
jgi:hypothetical protein